jgi:hypothetical protein
MIETTVMAVTPSPMTTDSHDDGDHPDGDNHEDDKQPRQCV